jgi:hypothetical protein
LMSFFKKQAFSLHERACFLSEKYFGNDTLLPKWCNTTSGSFVHSLIH